MSSLFKTYLLQKSFGSSDVASVLIWPYQQCKIGCPGRVHHAGWCVCFLLRPTVCILSNWKSRSKTCLFLGFGKGKWCLKCNQKDSGRAFLGLHPWKLIWQWKSSSWRCVSYWKWGFYIVMLAFCGVSATCLCFAASSHKPFNTHLLSIFAEAFCSFAFIVHCSSARSWMNLSTVSTLIVELVGGMHIPLNIQVSSNSEFLLP